MDYLEIDGVTVEIERKAIKNMYLSVRPPDGRVHLSVPRLYSDSAARKYLLSKWGWISRHREKILARTSVVAREYASGESFPLFGELYTLRVEECSSGKEEGVTLENGEIVLRVRAGADVERRKALLHAWGCRQIEPCIAGLMDIWTVKLGEKGVSWKLRNMKTLWGSCHLKTRTIVYNTKLFMMPRECVEYVVVHELTHFRVANHGPKFKALMSERLPEWPVLRRRLNEKR